MTKFKEGDKVNVYGNFEAGLFGYSNNPIKGIVVEVDVMYLIIKDTVRGFNGIVHRRQCRKLKKKEPRFYWVTVDSKGRTGFIYDQESSANNSARASNTFTLVKKLKAVK